MHRRHRQGRSRVRTSRWTSLLSCTVAGAVTMVGTASCSSAPNPQPEIPEASKAPCTLKPAAANTGASGPLQDSSTTVLKDGETLENARVASLEVRGTNITVRNVEVAGDAFIVGDNVTFDHVSAASIAISSASGTIVKYANIGNGIGDGIHVTSDSGRMVKNVLLTHNFIHTPRFEDDAHYDGTQVRGVDGLLISCSTYDPGRYQHTFNAAVFIEDANGGNTNVAVERNWLYGFGFSVMVDADNTRIVGNRVGGDIHWRTCLVGPMTDVASLDIRDNFNENTNAADPMCDAPGAQSR
jgi:archaellum component FlaG (FlaF/FlaG flagellin family)